MAGHCNLLQVAEPQLIRLSLRAVTRFLPWNTLNIESNRSASIYRIFFVEIFLLTMQVIEFFSVKYRKLLHKSDQPFST